MLIFFIRSVFLMFHLYFLDLFFISLILPVILIDFILISSSSRKHLIVVLMIRKFETFLHNTTLYMCDFFSGYLCIYIALTLQFFKLYFELFFWCNSYKFHCIFNVCVHVLIANILKYNGFLYIFLYILKLLNSQESP